MTNREKLKAVLSDISPNGELACIKYMDDVFGCPPGSTARCLKYMNDVFGCPPGPTARCLKDPFPCEVCWERWLESEVDI